MEGVKHIRISAELDALVKRAAAHIAIDETEIFRACAVYLRRGKCSTTKIPKKYYRNNRVVKSFRNFNIPAFVMMETFRKTVAARCLEVLEKPAYQPPVITDREGIDYIVKEEL